MSPVLDKPELVIFGDVALDVFLEVPGLPSKGEDVRVNRRAAFPGGSAANCAAMVAGLGVATRFLGNVGDDSTGRELAIDLNKTGVITDHLLTVAGDSGTTTCVLTPDGERTFFSYRGVNALHNPLHCSQDVLAHAAILHLSGYSFQDPGSRLTVSALLEKGRQHGCRISIDPSFVFASDNAVSPEKVLRGIDYFFPNRMEARLLCGTDDPLKAGSYLLDVGVGTVVFKLDQEGCLLVNRGGQQFVKGLTIQQPVDSTGAGDAFCAGFLTGQIWGLTDGDSAIIGHLAAANVVQSLGGHTRLLNRRDLIAQLKTHQFTELALKMEKLD